MKRPDASKRRVLTRERVIQKAIAHADVHGIEKLNMRMLAGRLKCGVMSLYNHVANKDDLFDGMIEVVASEIVVPAPDQDWWPAISEIAVSTRKALFRHRWAAGLWWRGNPGPNKLAHLESILRVLREGGFSVELACRGYHALSMHTIGFALQTADFPTSAKAMAAAARDFLSSVNPEEIPWFAEHIRHHMEHPEPSNEFSIVLDMILDGLEKNRREEGAKS